MKVVLLVLIALALVVTVQNTSVVTLRFLLWDASLSLVIVILLALALGASIGYLLGRFGRRGAGPDA